jgi:signal transduction histidine kinase
VVGVIFTSVRFSVGWYTARGFALIASCTVLTVLLTETTVLYARLAATLTLLCRERSNSLMSVDAATAAVAHEIRQPLAVISTSGYAALQWLKKTPSNLEEVRDCVEAMVEASARGDKVISSVRGLIRKTTNEKTAIHINDISRQVLSLLEHDLHVHGVAVTTQYQDDLPQIRADRTLLQQALLNLVKNAIDAMALVGPRTRRLGLMTRLDGNSSVVISVEDSGCGVAAEHQDRLFEPFFTSKPTGTGLGLSICRTIVEDHDGELRLTKTDSRGSTFEIALPFDSRRDRVGTAEP